MFQTTNQLGMRSFPKYDMNACFGNKLWIARVTQLGTTASLDGYHKIGK